METSYNKKRTILHSDLNNFYASVECVLRPELRDKPVAVCGKAEERHGIVLAKNYLAKAKGVKTGETINQAKCKCPNLLTVDPHYGEYLKYSKLVRQIYSDYSDMIEPYGMDENWIDVTGSTMILGSGEKIANEIRERIKHELGLTVSIGVSFNKIFAKLGSDLKKPDAVTCISAEDFREKIWNLPAGDMLGVGPAAAKELTKFGIDTIGALAGCPDILLTTKFGINGLRMKQFANGEDTSSVMKTDYSAPIKSVGNGITFLSDLETNDEVAPMILSLADEVARRLREARKKAKGVSLTVKCCDLAWKEWQTGLDHPTSNAIELSKRAFEIFKQNYPWVKPIRALTVRAIRLQPDDAPEQLSMFGDSVRSQKLASIDKAMDKIRDRYGRSSIINAAAMHLDKLPKSDDVELIMPTGMLNLA